MNKRMYKKRVVSHLKEDIKEHKEAIREDKKLIMDSKCKKKSMSKPKKNILTVKVM